jgi:hypothetical protein
LHFQAPFFVLCNPVYVVPFIAHWPMVIEARLVSEFFPTANALVRHVFEEDKNRVIT